MMQHRHFKKIASIIAMIDDTAQRADVALLFANNLAGTNPSFDRGRFIAAANGEPIGRDR